tara:strand:- start:20 stop:610 length:591 start_codon:yes stop_codon:yes gene_type:complete
VIKSSMKKLLLTILLSLFFSTAGFADNDYEVPKYSLVSTQVLEEVCRNSWCVNTVKKEILSSDGFLFETYTTNDTDAVWCLPYTDENQPCSTIGDTGAGKNEMIIHDVKNNKKTKIINNSPSGRITRLETSSKYKYIVMETYTGGASCCSIIELYSKQDVSLAPFVIEETMGNFFINENKTFLNIEYVIDNHFKKQ